MPPRQSPGAGPVEAPGHEMGQPAFLEQMDLGGLQAGVAGHPVVGVLDPVVGPRLRVGVLQFSHTVELDQPRLVAGTQWRKSAADLVSLAVPEDDRLGPRPARRRAHLHDLRQCHVHPALDDPPGLLHQPGHLQRLFGDRGHGEINSRFKFQGTHRPAADVEQSLDGAQRILRPAGPLEVLPDYGIAEGIGERIGQYTGQALEGVEPPERWKADRTQPGQRQVSR
jgi:hypothetical protein